MALQFEPHTQLEEFSFPLWVEPNVKARLFPKDVKDPVIGDSGVTPRAGPWTPAQPMASVPGLGDMAWEFERRTTSNQTNSGNSWLTRFEASLSDALSDLREATKEAHEKEFQSPCDAVLANADRILREMYQIRKMRFEVYPLEDGEVAIDAPGEGNTSVFVSCETDGSALCIVRIDGKNQLRRYATAAELPDEFLTGSLRCLVARRE